MSKRISITHPYSKLRKLHKIVQQFFPDQTPRSVLPFGGGHINDTYKIIFAHQSFLLQRLNHHVFTAPKKVMQNISTVSECLTRQHFSEYILTPMLTKKGKLFYQSETGNYWRVFPFFEQTITLEKAETPNQAFQAAKAYASFSKALSPLNSQQIVEPIPDFHNSKKRLQNFRIAVQEDVGNRVLKVSPEIKWIEGNLDILTKIEQLALPHRITHNDTKISNILFDEKGQDALAVIDWDTIMPGTVLADFGDMVRTFASSGVEDETDLTKICIRPAYYEAIEKGYLQAWGSNLTLLEKNNLKNGAKWMILLQGIRFLTDYLQGDSYYKINYADHNLVRAKNQLHLLKSLIEIT